MIDAVVIGVSFVIDIFTLFVEERYRNVLWCGICVRERCSLRCETDRWTTCVRQFSTVQCTRSRLDVEVEGTPEQYCSVVYCSARRRLSVMLCCAVRSAHQATLTILLLLWRILRLINGTPPLLSLFSPHTHLLASLLPILCSVLYCTVWYKYRTGLGLDVQTCDGVAGHSLLYCPCAPIDVASWMPNERPDVPVDCCLRVLSNTKRIWGAGAQAS